MNVRAKKRAPIRKGKLPPPQPAQAFNFAPPVRGLVLNENMSVPGRAGALILDNWICTTQGAKVRGGCTSHSILPTAVQSLWVYRSGGTESMFAATATAIYNVSSPSATTPAAAVTGQTAGRYSTQQFGTAGGDYLYAVNGADPAQLYDGATWTPITGTGTISITGATTSNFKHVWSFASRLFFVRANSMIVDYLPVDSIGGAASQFSLAGIFQRGGSLLFGATWSLDAGDGLDDKCVFVSSEGEVAIYEGTNPGSAADFRKVGVYQITRPLGPNAKMQAGGDLMIATVSGLIPLSEAIRKDVAALSLNAITSPIGPLWDEKAQTLTAPWEIIKWPEENVMIVSQPGDAEKTCLVANLETGAWSRFTGWDVNTMAFFDESGFFGSQNGRIYRMESGGSDNGVNYTSVFLGQHEGMNAQGVQKTVGMIKATFDTASPINPMVTVQVDYSRETELAPSAALDGDTAALWDSALWDSAVWDGGVERRTQDTWNAGGRTGYAIAPEVQLTFGNTAKPDVKLVSIDATYSIGALVA